MTIHRYALIKVWWRRRHDERILDLRARESGAIVVREREGHRELVEIAEREMVHTRVRIAEPLISGFAYTDAMHGARWLISTPNPRVLCLGGGGFLLPQQLASRTDHEVDAVENAQDMIDLARAYFIKDEKETFKIHCADASVFLDQCVTTYDLIVIDLFGPFEASPLLGQVRFFEQVAQSLSCGGAIAVNMVGALDGTNGAMLATTQAMHVAFAGHVLTLPMLSDEERKAQVLATSSPRNVIAYATKERLPKELRRPPSSSRLLPRLNDALIELNRQLQALAAARTGAPMRLVFA
jgi:spermidine synthase